MEWTKELLEKTVEQQLPKFAQLCKGEIENIMMTQSAFNLSSNDVLLLGVAIKHAGLMGKNVTIIAD